MQAGKLRHRIEILRPLYAAPNEYGERVPTYPVWQRVWAEIEPLAAREIEFAHSFAMTVSHKLRIRFLPDIAAGMRIRHGVRVFEINGITSPDERAIENNLFCTELAPAVMS